MKSRWMFILSLYFSFVVTFGYENLSQFQKATQSSRNNDTEYSPTRAVDKNINTCSSTGADNPAWWYVDLEEVKSIHGIQIYFKGTGTTNEQRQREFMYGYQLYVSNTTDLHGLGNSHLCYNNSGPSLPDLIFTHVCISFGRYIIFYNERVPGVTYPTADDRIQNSTHVQLCEVVVSGCKAAGRYGENCFNPCPIHCQEQRCYITNGTCVGCTDGWTGSTCKEPCMEGYFGLECRGICSNNCLNNGTCNHTTGICDNGCSEGWTGGRCNMSCMAGTYGADCSMNCSGNCLNGTSCNKVTGVCDEGCTSGYTGEGCDQVCTPGTYGAGCIKNCSGNCLNGTSCSIMTGECDEGCSLGYTGKKCDQVCIHGTYGESCSQNCSGNCMNGAPCNTVNGVCDKGCSAGYINKRCDQECPSGSFGIGCRSNCSGNCNNENCSNVDGSCIHGCKAGFQGLLCDKRCTEGTYGDCIQRCSGNCINNETCNFLDGHCKNGCDPGYQARKCNSVCGSGSYGQNCSQNCSENCKYSKCHHVYGTCTCKAGWKGADCSTECSNGTFGENCHRNCSDHCRNNELCNNVNGICPNGCQINYESPTCHTSKPSKANSQKLNTTIIIIVVAVAVTVILMIILAVLIRKRGKHKSHEYDHGLELIATNSLQNDLKKGDDEIHSYENAAAELHGEVEASNLKQRIIPIDDLPKTIAEMSQDTSEENGFSFKAEYKQIPKGELRPCNTGKREENKIKNRYFTTFPYDHSRVVLQMANQKSDYINANYIKDISGEQRYIATQGPKKKTVADFWTMIWQESVTVIVCLTNLKEGSNGKCAQYWPNCNDKVQCGNFAIRNQEEKEYSNYIKRHLRLQDIIGEEEQDVWMFHYTQWPDHGVPEAINLVVFHRHVMRAFAESSGQNKMVVHCSAGLGRTGTFIALDALYRDGLRSGSVNVPEYVTQMRHDRMNMVQGEDQYKMIYTALHESFRGHLRPLDAKSFLSQYQSSPHYKDLKDENKKTQEIEEFKELNLLKPQCTAEDRKSAHMNDTFENYRCSVLDDNDRPVYYNAVILQSFTKPDGLISAQYPLENQCEDFLYLVKESRASTVLFLGTLEDIPSTKVWFPSKNDSKVVGTFTVKLANCDSSAVVTKTNIIIQKKGFHDTRISILECNFWKGDGLTAECRKVLDAINKTKLEEKAHPNSRTLVLSSDGARRCGPLCVAYNAIEQLILDKEVDIFTAVRLLQIRRPEFISTVEEYRFCHDLVAEYLQSDAVYENFSL